MSEYEDIEVEGVDPSDYPDFVDAYVVHATLNGRVLTEQQLDVLNDKHPEIAQTHAFESLL